MRRTLTRPSTAATLGTAAYELHDDGTVTMWSCARQSWERGVPTDADLAECDTAMRGDIEAHIAQHRS